MALLTSLPEKAEPPKPTPPPSKRKKRENPTDQTQKSHKPQKHKAVAPQKQHSSWDQIKNLLTCKQIEGSRIHDPSKNSQSGPSTTSHLSPSKLSSSCSSICSFREVAHGNTRVVHRADNSPEVANSATADSDTCVLTRKPGQHGFCSSSSRSRTSGSSRSNASGSNTSSSTTSFRAMQFSKLAGCYECHMIIDPSRFPISPRVCACSQCGEVFPKLESLEHLH